jgi:signal transduction histidine kinase
MASLLENTALDSKQRPFVRTLRNSAEALITLINDVLDLSKAEAGKLDLHCAPSTCVRELEQVVGLFTAAPTTAASRSPRTSLATCRPSCTAMPSACARCSATW